MQAFPVVGILGPRQCGKTTLARQLMNESADEFIYIDCEHPRDLARISDPVLFFENNMHKCIVIDEIQMQPGLFPVLRSIIDQDRRPGKFVILGSASPDLIHDSSESLAGRISYKELYPFNYLEVSGNINDHWFRGGYPDAFLQNDEELRQEWYLNFIKTYIERDLPSLGLDSSASLLARFWKMLATMHGNVINKSNLSKSISLSFPTITKYLNFLEETFLINQLQPFHVNLKKRLVKSPKIYLRDSGILHHQLGITHFDSLQAHSYLGVSWEGYIIEQIKHLLPLGYELFFYRTHEGTEMDLLICRSGTPWAGIEIKYTSSPKISKSLSIAVEDLQTKHNYIIIPTKDNYQLRKDITVCGLKEFLERLVAEDL